MANTLIPIQTYTLSATTASVTFSNIPQNYTDLKLVVSARNTSNSNNTIQLFLNSDTTVSNYNIRRVYSDGSTTDGATFAAPYVFYVPTPSSLAATFSSTEIYVPSYTNSVAKVFSAEGTAETNASTGHSLTVVAGKWTGTSAITVISLIPYAGTFDVASTFTLYGISNGVKATGGTLTVAGGYAYHTFTSTASFLPNQQIKGAEILAVAGGGPSSYRFSGGGGAGGVLYAGSQSLNAGTVYTALVGAGGSGSAGAGAPSAGTNSSFSSLNAISGGIGGGTNYNSGLGLSGGSGGGGTSQTTYGTGTSGQGNNGGVGGYFRCGGGGGGAGGVGEAAYPLTNTTGSGAYGGNGGVGTSAYSTWGLATGTGHNVSGIVYYAGGGGGGANLGNGGDPSYTSGHSLGGYGGGGNGGAGNNGGASQSLQTQTAGTANTGGGGGGNEQSGTAAQGNGGSGLIIVRYPLS